MILDDYYASLYTWKYTCIMTTNGYLSMFCLRQDIIHCHDWSSAPVSWLFKEQYMHYGLSKARVVFTIHNLEFGAPLIGRAMLYSDKATTVSNLILLKALPFMI